MMYDKPKPGARLARYLALRNMQNRSNSAPADIAGGAPAYPFSLNNLQHMRSIGGLGGFSSLVSGGEGQGQKKRRRTSRSAHEKGEAFAGLGEWIVYNKTVRENDKLSNAEKAEKARNWAHNFQVKGYGYYQLEAEKDAEVYQRVADEEARRRRISRETEERRRRHERTCPSCHQREPEETPVVPPWRYPETQEPSDDKQD